MNLLRMRFKAVYYLLMLNSSSAYASKIKMNNQSPAQQKKSSSLKIGQMSRSTLSVKFTWQTIRSLGLGSKMSTAVETFAADGEIAPVGMNQWILKILGSEAPVYLTPPSTNAESMIFVERDDLLKLLGLNSNLGGPLVDPDQPSIRGSSTTIQLVLSKGNNRYLETVYRSPDDDLFLVKVSAVLLSQK